MLTITVDTAGIMDLARALEATGHKLPSAQALVLNRVGTRVKRVVIPTLSAQTGLSKKIITKAVRMGRASPQNPRVALYTRGGEISLRFFGAHEVEAGAAAGAITAKSHGVTLSAKSGKTLKGGVVAKIRGQNTLFLGAFRRSGGRGNRRLVPKLNGATFLNDEGGKWSGKMHSIRSGVFIPVEMVNGATRKAFEQIVATELPREVEKELAKLLPKGK